jgi:hypothetical protein
MHISFTRAFSEKGWQPRRKFSGFVDFWLAPLKGFWYDKLVRKSALTGGQGKRVAVCRCQAMKNK